MESVAIENFRLSVCGCLGALAHHFDEEVSRNQREGRCSTDFGTDQASDRVLYHSLILRLAILAIAMAKQAITVAVGLLMK